MNKNRIVIAVVAVALIGAGLWYFSVRPKTVKEADQSSNETANTPSTGAPTAVTKTGTWGSLMKQGGNYTCNVSTISDTGKTSGTVYASDGKVRFDFQIQSAEGMTITSHMIRDGSVSYSWIDGSPRGVKTAITTSGSVAPGPTGGTIQVNDDEQVASDCRPWLPDTSQFTPPKGITF